jgi:hypothetical protein
VCVSLHLVFFKELPVEYSVAKKFSLLLFYEKLSASAPVVHALHAKGLEVIAVDNHNDLVNQINKKSIDLVGLSVNHANEAAVSQLLTNSFIPFFMFGEDTTAATARKLNACTAEIKIPGVVSSYTIWMHIAHFVKEKTEANSDAVKGKVVVFGGPKKEGVGTVNVATPAHISTAPSIADGEIKIMDAPTQTIVRGTLKILEAEKQRLGKISTQVSKKFQEQLLRVIGEWTPHELSSKDKFPAMEKIKVIPIRNENEKGLLLFAGDRPVDNLHLEFLRNAISEKIEGPDFECGEVYEFDMSIPDICGWSNENCLFSFVYDRGARCLVSYLKRDDILPDFVHTENFEMSGVSIDDLPPRPTLDFDLFLYFNRNDKLVPYIKKGDVINQDKLQSRPGMKILYFKDEDRKKLNSIFIEAVLKTTFDRFKAKLPPL